MLRFLTAGESHGRALVVIVEGLPAGLPVTVEDDRGRAGPPPARLRPRAPHAVRSGRARRCSAASATAARSARRSPSRSATASGPKIRQVAEGDVAARRGRSDQGAADPAPARPRRPRRHAEVRLRRRPRRARAGLRPRDGGPGRRRRAGQGAAAPSSASRSSRHVIQIGAVRAEGRRSPDARPTSRPSTSRRCAASTPPPRRR